MMTSLYPRLSLPPPPNPVQIYEGEPPQLFIERFNVWLQDTSYLKQESTVQHVLADLINYSRDSRVIYNPENVDLRFLVAIAIGALKRDLDVRAQANTMKDTVIPEIQQLIQTTQDEKKILQEKYEKLYEEKKKLQSAYDAVMIDRRSKASDSASLALMQTRYEREKVKLKEALKELEELKTTHFESLKSEAATLAENIEIKSNLKKLEEEKDELKVDLELQKAAYQTLKNNTGTTRNKSSDYLGVRKLSTPSVTRSKPWSAQIRQDGKQVYLGVYATEEEAAEACLYAKAPNLKNIKEELEQLKASSPDLLRLQTENASLRTTLEQYSKEITHLEKNSLSALELQSKTRVINQLKQENESLVQRVNSHDAVLETYKEEANKIIVGFQKKCTSFESKIAELERMNGAGNGDPVKINIIISQESDLRKENFYLKEELSQWSVMYNQRSTEWKEEIIKEKEDHRRLVLFLNQKITTLENEIKEETEPLSKRSRKPVELYQPYTLKDLVNKHKRGRHVLKVEDEEL